MAVVITPAASPAAGSRFRDIDWSKGLFVATAFILFLLVALPTGWLAWYSVTDAAGHLTLANFGRLLTDWTLLGPLIVSLEVAVGSAAGAVAAALPLAWLVARTDMPLRGAVRALVMATFVTPPFLGAVAWELLAGPNAGLLNQFARSLFGLDEFDYVFDIYTVAGLTFTTACYTFPYVFILVANALERVPADLEHASAILGASGWVTARRVTIPMILPAITAGCLVAFLQALTMFGAPGILALPGGFHTLTTKIASLFQYPPQTNLAAAAAMPLLLITIGVLQLQRRMLGRRGFTVIGGKSSSPRCIELGAWKIPSLIGAAVILALPIFLPYAALLKAALIRNLSDPISLETLTLDHVRVALLDYSGTRSAVVNTFILGVASATIVTFMALVIGYLVTRRAVPGHRALSALAVTPLAIPGIVMGVGLFLVYARPPFLLYGTLWILLIGFITMEMPAGFQQVQSALGSIHVDIEEAARIFGASRLRMLLQITMPLLRTTIIATWCIVFIGVIRELSATILLTTSNTKVVSVIIFDLNETGDLGAIAVLGLAVLFVTFAVVILVNRLPMVGPRTKLSA